MAAVTFDVPFVLGMMRLHEAQEMHQASQLADWIEARLEQGLHGFDHADIYGSGACETLFGQALRARPALAKRLHVVTKASIANDNPSAGGQLMQGEVSRVLNRLAGELVSTPGAGDGQRESGAHCRYAQWPGSPAARSLVRTA